MNFISSSPQRSRFEENRPKTPASEGKMNCQGLGVGSSPGALLPAFVPMRMGKGTIDTQEDYEQPLKIHEDPPSSPIGDSKRFPSMSVFYPTPAPSSLPAHGSSSPVPSPGRYSDNNDMDSGTENHIANNTNNKPTLGTFDVRGFDIRAPLSTITLVRVPKSGRPITIGRSSKRCEVTVDKANRKVSRAHLRVRFEQQSDLIVIDCLGDNGVIVHVPEYKETSSPGKGKTAIGQTEYPVIKRQTILIEYVPGISVDIVGERALFELTDDSSSAIDNDETEEEEPVRRVLDEISSNTVLNSVAMERSKPTSSPNVKTTHERSHSHSLVLSSSSHLLLSDNCQQDDHVVGNNKSIVQDKVIEEPSNIEKHTKNIDSVDGNIQEKARADSGIQEQTQSEVDGDKPQIHQEITQVKKHIVHKEPESPSGDGHKTKGNETKINSHSEVDSSVSNHLSETNSSHQQKVQQKQQITPKHQKQADLPDNLIKDATHKISRQASSEPGPKKRQLHEASDKVKDISDQNRKMQKSKSGLPSRHNSRQNTPQAPEMDIELSSDEMTQIRHLATNHLAFSRLSSTPISIIQKSNSAMGNLSKSQLRHLLTEIRCIGVIHRQGKDASGKPLEEEYYYLPEHDDDVHRVSMVEQSRGHGGLRACRRTHKQYFWKKPSAL